jgi:hypothetical protein
MSTDLYTEWLKIPPGHRPPDHYALLGLERFCSDASAIEQAVADRMELLDRYALHRDSARRSACQQMMNEVAQARIVLIDPQRRTAYDQTLEPAEPKVAAAEDRAMPEVEQWQTPTLAAPVPFVRPPSIEPRIDSKPLGAMFGQPHSAPATPLTMQDGESSQPAVPAADGDGEPRWKLERARRRQKARRMKWLAAALAVVVTLVAAIIFSVAKKEDSGGTTAAGNKAVGTREEQDRCHELIATAIAEANAGHSEESLTAFLEASELSRRKNIPIPADQRGRLVQILINMGTAGAAVPWPPEPSQDPAALREKFFDYAKTRSSGRERNLQFLAAAAHIAADPAPLLRQIEQEKGDGSRSEMALVVAHLADASAAAAEGRADAAAHALHVPNGPPMFAGPILFPEINPAVRARWEAAVNHCNAAIQRFTGGSFEDSAKEWRACRDDYAQVESIEAILRRVRTAEADYLTKVDELGEENLKKYAAQEWAKALAAAAEAHAAEAAAGDDPAAFEKVVMSYDNVKLMIATTAEPHLKIQRVARAEATVEALAQLLALDPNNDRARQLLEQAVEAVQRDGGKLVVDKLPPRSIFRDEGKVRRIAFVCDASGSMLQNSKMTIVNEQLINAVTRLTPYQSFEIIFLHVQGYDSFMKYSHTGGLVPVAAGSRRGAAAFVRGVVPIGSADPVPGMKAAFKTRPQLIYLLTDHDFPDNDALLKTVRDENRNFPVKINTIALVSDVDKDVAFLESLKTIAKESGGTFRLMKVSDF